MTGTDPSPDRLRRDFLRFRDRGDAAALARVFDALGPRLLLLAAHLCREPDAAEDLVQTTFLAAMRSADGYDGKRDLEAWLVGILRHRAVDAARRRDRRRDAGAGELDAVADRGPGPLEATASQEQLDTLSRAIDGLPAPYRDVAALRIVHGLEPVAIARALGRAPGTVRMQCQRALEMLRRALPAGLAGALLPPAGWLRSWDAVRAEVLTAAEQTAVPVTTSLLLTGAVMTTMQKILAAAAAVLLAVLGYVAWPTAEASRPATNRPTSARTEAAAASTEADAAAASPTAAAATARREATLPSGPPSTTPTVRGRAVDERGEPLAGVTVSLPEVYVPEDTHRTVERLDAPPTIATGTDGRFALRIARLPANASGLRLALEHPQRTRAEGKLDWPLPDGELDVGDVVIPPGVRIAGRVVERDGRPVAEAWVELRTRTMHDERTSIAAPGDMTLWTDESGRFATRERLDARSGSAYFQVTGRQLVGPWERRIERHGSVWNLELVVEPERETPGLAGRVVTPSGEPIAGAWVHANALGANPAWTDDDGRFVVQRDPDLAAPAVPFAVDTTAPGHRRARVEARWLDRDLRIVLEPIPAITVRVVDARTDAPVERFGATLLKNGAGSDRRDYTPVETVPEQLHEAGRLVFDTPPDGHLGVRVTAADAALWPSSLVELPAEDVTPREITVRLTPPATRTVRLTAADGAPLAGITVTCVDSFGLSPSIFDEAFAWEDWGELSGAFLKMLVIARSTTDTDGRCSLRGPAGRDLHLWLTGEGVARQMRGPFRLDAPGDLELEPTPEAVWTGRIVPAGAVHDLVAMSAAASDDQGRRGRGFELHDGDELWGSLLRYLEPALPFADDGSFRIGGLPAGTWQVRLITPQDSRSIGAVTVKAGETLEQDVDIAAIWPSEVELGVSLDGVPAAKRPVVAYYDHIPMPGEARPVGQDFLRTDESGLLRRWCFPGELELQVRTPEGSLWAAPIRIPAGRPLRQRVELHSGALELTVVDANGAPLPDLELRIGRGRWSWTDGSRRTDVEGKHRVDPIAAGPQTIRGRRPKVAKTVGRNEGWVELGTVEVRVGDDATTARLVWPTKTR